MRILLTCDPMIPVPPVGYGGIERIVDGLARELRRRGHTVGLVGHRDSTCQTDGFWPWPGTEVRSRPDTIRNIRALVGIARNFEPDVVHSFARLAYLSGLLLSPTPKIMSYQRLAHGVQIRLAAAAAGRTLHYTACSRFIAEGGRTSGGTWHAIPNFIEPDRIPFEPQVPTDAPLLFLSRVESIKGADVAIAVAKASGRRLVIAGNHATSGPEYEYWRDQVLPHLDSDGISYVGEVGDEQKFKLLGQAAALVVPIRWDEPFGIVFIEALAAGTPVITCPRGALPEIVTPGVNGWFMDTIDDGERAVARLPLIDRATCRNVAVQSFSRSVVVEQYFSLYESLRLQSNGRPSHS